MKLFRYMAIAFAASLAAMAGGWARPQVAPPATRFHAVEIWIDSKAAPLAAYQIEFQPAAADAKIVGIEGGAHAEFSDPPYYDPAAMRRERVIIADFSTAPAEKLPVGRVRIATIHIQVQGEQAPQFELNVQASATTQGRRIPVDAQAQLRSAAPTSAE